MILSRYFKPNERISPPYFMSFIRKHRIGLGFHALIDSVFECRPCDLNAHMDIFCVARKHLSMHKKGGSGVAERALLTKRRRTQSERDMKRC